MLFFQDDKDKLKQELENILEAKLSHKVDMLGHRVDSLTHPHGARKDGTPRAKPGRKPREQR